MMFFAHFLLTTGFIGSLLVVPADAHKAVDGEPHWRGIFKSPDMYATIQLPDGTTLKGTVNGTIASFKGIPFATAPVGSLRWAPPKPWVNPNTSNVFDATEFGPVCKQTRDGSTFGDEDCLYLNVYVDLTKTAEKGQDTPVGVYIHGGSYKNGEGSDYDGTDLLNYVNGSAVLVSMNYRLNVFGFAGADQLRVQDSDASSTGNYGFQDQRMAMQWVAENIGAFGGNSSRVTIYGESAGAGSVSNHLAMHKSWPYFHRAILESGSFAEWVTQPMYLAQGGYDALVQALGCSTTTTTSNIVDADAELQCMLAKSMNEVYEASLTVPSMDLAYESPWQPTADFVELDTHPYIALANGDIADVPILHGSNTDEGSMFLPLPLDVDEAGLLLYWKAFSYTPKEMAEMLALYVVNKEYPIIADVKEQPSVYWWAGQRMLGDVVFTCTNRYTSEHLSKLEEQGRRLSPTYLYHFEYLANGSSVPYVQHTAEIPYVWHMNNYIGSVSDADMMNIMSTYWINFMSSGDPNGGTTEAANPPLQLHSAWPRYKIETDENLAIYGPTDITVKSGLKHKECLFSNPRTIASIRENFPPNASK